MIKRLENYEFRQMDIELEKDPVDILLSLLPAASADPVKTSSQPLRFPESAQSAALSEQKTTSTTRRPRTTTKRTPVMKSSSKNKGSGLKSQINAIIVSYIIYHVLI